MRQLVAVASVVLCLSANAGSIPTTSPPPAPGFIVLTQPVKVKIAYGETTLPAGMRLPVVSSDTTSVRVNYMGELQTIPIAAARFETATNEPADAASAPTTPINSTKPASQPSSTPVSQLQVSL